MGSEQEGDSGMSTEATSSWYLVRWGGADQDRAYKDAGELTFVGPFEDVDDAWGFMAAYTNIEVADARVYNVDYAVVEGSILSVNGEAVATPQAALQERVSDYWSIYAVDEDDTVESMFGEELRALMARYDVSLPEEGDDEQS